jgi:hypothetical protein
MLYPERGGELRLLAFRGFKCHSGEVLGVVRAESNSTCGTALRTGRRSLVPDVKTGDTKHQLSKPMGSGRWVGNSNVDIQNRRDVSSSDH